MTFNSVFDSLSDVKSTLQSGRIDSNNLIITIDKTSIGIFLGKKVVILRAMMSPII